MTFDARDPRWATCSVGCRPAAGIHRYGCENADYEYSPEYQDEYRRLWHETAAARDDYKLALRTIMDVPSQETLMLNAEARAMYEIAARAIEADTRHVG